MASDKPVRMTSEILVSNASCTIQRQGQDVLDCKTRGRTGTLAIFGLGILLIYGSIGMIAWHLPDAKLNLLFLSGGFFALGAGLLLQWRGMRRQKELGNFRIDRHSRLIQKEDTAIQYTFEDIVYVRLAFDFTGRSRPPLSYWLFVHFKDGRKFRIGRGTKNELQRTMTWLKLNGLPVSIGE